MLLSVITITKDNLAGLKDTWHSLKEQKNFIDYEWLIIDGASTDGTLAWLKDIPKADWHSAPDNGIYDAMNKGLERAQGTWVLFLNAGDTLADPQTLAKMSVFILQHKDVDFVYGDALEGTDKNAPFYKSARPIHTIVQGMPTHHQAMLYRRSALYPLRYDMRWRVAADYDLTARFILKIGYDRATYFQIPVCFFASGGLSQKEAVLGRFEENAIRKNLNLIGPFGRFLIRLRQSLTLALRRTFPAVYFWLRG